MPTVDQSYIPEHLPALHCIRGVAAVGVTYVHAVQLLPGSEEGSIFSTLAPLTYLGAAGVDLFFVLSGFLMFHLRESYDRRGCVHFLLARAIRIAPLYWLCTLAFAAMLVAGGRAESIPSLRELIASLMFVPMLNHAASYQPVLAVGWSLNYEIIFYILFAPLLAVKNPWRLIAILAIPVSGLVVLHYKLYLFEFLLGGIVFAVHGIRSERQAHSGSKTSPKNNHVIWCAIATIFILLLATSQEVYLQGGTLRLFAWGIGAALIVYLVLGIRKVNHPFSKAGIAVSIVLSWLGNISYSLYLSHWIVGIVLHKILAQQSWGLSISFRISVVFLVSIAIGQILHRLIERPIDRELRTRLLHHRKATKVTSSG